MPEEVMAVMEPVRPDHAATQLASESARLTMFAHELLAREKKHTDRLSTARMPVMSTATSCWPGRRSTQTG
jgi:hypothetical protein